MTRATLCSFLSSCTTLVFQPSFSQADFWEPTNGPRGGEVYSLAVSTSGDVYAGTDGGVYRSTDRAEFWEPSGLGNYRVNALVLKSDEYLFAGTSFGGVHRFSIISELWTQTSLDSVFIYALLIIPGGDIIAGGATVYRSSDNGESWVETTNYVGSQTFTIGMDGKLFSGTVFGVFRSSDKGFTWEQSGLIEESIASLAVDSSGNIWAGTYNYDRTNSVYRSTDNGSSWESSGLSNTIVYALASVSDSLILAATDVGLFRSTNDGNIWNQVGPPDSLFFSLGLSPTREIFAGNYIDGVFRSVDDGITWTASDSGLMNTRVHSLAVDSTGAVLAGMSYPRFGIYRSSDNGDLWVRTAFPSFFDVYALTVTSSGSVLAATHQWGGLFRSTDNGWSWTQILGFEGTICRSFALHPGGAVFLGTTGSVWRSTDDGISWSQTSLNTEAVHALTINSRGMIFAGVYAYGVYRSTDEGLSWTQTINGLGEVSVRSLAVGRSDKLFAGTSFTSIGIFTSTDDGENWVASDVTSSIYAFTINSHGEVFAASNSSIEVGSTGDGVFRSTDNGESWNELNEGFLNTHAWSLVTSRNDYVFVGTDGGGVARSVKPTVTSASQGGRQSPTSLAIRQNYPNPFNPTTTIRFSIPIAGDVSLKIFNLLGEEVATLASSEMAAGTHAFQWDATGQPSGVYFYRLQAGEFVETRKLVLIR